MKFFLNSLFLFIFVFSANTTLSAFKYDVSNYQASEMLDMSSTAFPEDGIFPDRGVVSRDGDIYVASSATNEIWRVTSNTEDGMIDAFKVIGADVLNPNGFPYFTLGVDIDNQNTIWNTTGAGLYRTRDGEATEQVVFNDGTLGNPIDVHPEEVAVHRLGKIYFVDFLSGNVWLYDENSDSVSLAADSSAPGYEDLKGTPAAPPQKPFSVGMIGIEIFQNHLYGVNNDTGLVLRMEIMPDGSLGLPEVLTSVPPSGLGLDIDPRTKALFVSNIAGQMWLLDLKDLGAPLEEFVIPDLLKGTFTDVIVGFGFDDTNTKGANRNIYILDGALQDIPAFMGSGKSTGRMIRVEPIQN